MRLKRKTALFIRYIAFFSIPILCMAMLLLSSSISNRYDSIQKEAMSRLSEASAQLDMFSAKMSTTALHMSGNERLTNLDSSSFDPATYTATKIFGLLRSYEESLPDDISLLFYLRGGKNIYANKKFFPYVDFLASDDYEPELGHSDLYLSLNSVSSKRVVGIGSDDSSAKYCAAVFYPIPEIADNPKSTVCFLISKSYAQQTLEQYFPNMDASAFVVSSTGSVIYNSASQLYSEGQLQEILSKNTQRGILNLNIDGKAYILLRGQSANTGVDYVVFIPRNIFYASNNYSTFTLLILVGLMLVFSAVAALYLARGYYSNLERADNKNIIITQELNARNNLIKEMVLRRLLMGTIQNDDEQTLTYNLSCANLHFEYNNFFVILILFNVLTVDDKVFEETEASIAEVSINETNIYPVQLADTNGIALILNCGDHVKERTGSLTAITQHISTLNLPSFLIGCSRIHHTAYHIDNAYVEATVAITEKLHPLRENVYQYGEKAQSSGEKDFQYPYAEQALIEQSIKNGNASIAISAVNHVLDKIESLEQSMLIQKCLHFDIINMLVKIAASIHQPISSTEISQLSSWNNVSSLKTQISDIINRLVSADAESKKKQQTTTKYALIQYMQEHFKENDLSLDSFASEFNLSYTYISKVFKDETGQPFLSYLTQLRFTYIKQQLKETNLPIKDIAAAAGYNDLTNFMRKFKSMEGVTPNQYRREATV